MKMILMLYLVPLLLNLLHCCIQTHLFFGAILVVRELVEEGLLPPVVATNRVNIAFHPASLVLFSIGHSFSFFAGYHVIEIARK